MRGPGLRTLCDVRRTWKCPRCGYIRRASAADTSVRCQCNSDEPFMRLVEAKRPERRIPEPLDLSWEYVPDPSEEAESITTSANQPAATQEPAAHSEPIEAQFIESPPVVADVEDESEDDSDESDPLSQEQSDGETPEAAPGTNPGPAKKKKRRRRNRRPPEAS